MVLSEGLRQSLRAIENEFAETKNELDRTKTILEKAEHDLLRNEVLLAETNSKLRESQSELIYIKAKIHSNLNIFKRLAYSRMLNEKTTYRLFNAFIRPHLQSLLNIYPILSQSL